MQRVVTHWRTQGNVTALRSSDQIVVLDLRLRACYAVCDIRGDQLGDSSDIDQPCRDRVLALWHTDSSRRFDARFTELMELRTRVHEHIAREFEPLLNAHVAQLPQSTAAEKQVLVRRVNDVIRALGLAIKCPKTGMPGMLHADHGANAPNGRFQIHVFGSSLGRARSMSARDLFQLTLIPDVSRRHPLAEYWSKRISSRPGPDLQNR